MLTIPYPGTKREAYKTVREIFKEGGYDKVMEPFGGSCVLSVNLKNEGLAKEAVINDYDGMFDLYPEYLDIKDWIVNEFHKRGWYRTCRSSRRGCYTFTGPDETEWVPAERGLPRERVEFLRGLVSQVDEKYWRLLAMGSNFCHAGVPTHKKIHLSEFMYFDSYVKTDRQREYLKAVNDCRRMSMDYREFIEANRDGITGKTLLIVDPPYFGRANNLYMSDFTEEDTREMLRLVKSTGADFVLFESDADWVDRTLTEMGLEHTRPERFGNPTQAVNHRRRECMTYVRGDGC